MRAHLALSLLFAAACGGGGPPAGSSAGSDAGGGVDAGGAIDGGGGGDATGGIDAASDAGPVPDADPAARRPGSMTPVRSDRISMNGLDAVHLDALLQGDAATVHALASAAISSGFVSSARMVLATGAAQTLAATANGRELLGYLTRCAFNKGDELAVYDAAADVTYVFHGGMALARGWEYGPLTLAEQRWVSGCVMAHVNAYGLAVPVLLRGGHPQLAAPTDPNQADWMSVREAGFYGNLFIPGYYDPAPLNACRPEAYLALRYQTPDWDKRLCTDGSGGYTNCGFVDQGRCYPPDGITVVDWLHGASGEIGCEAIHPDGYYQPCCEAGPTEASNGTCEVFTDFISGYSFQRYDEVITVYLRDLDAPDLAGTVAPPMTIEPGNTAVP